MSKKSRKTDEAPQSVHSPRATKSGKTKSSKGAKPTEPTPEMPIQGATPGTSNPGTAAPEDGRIVITTEEIIEFLQQLASSVAEEEAGRTSFVVQANDYDFRRNQNRYRRRIFIYGEILPPEEYSDLVYGMTAANVIEDIMEYNREDFGVPVENRKPVVIYINSPGGSVTDGFAIIAAIKASKTPIYTVNVGRWCSMAFLIGIAGHKRFSLPNMTFLLHDGTAFVAGSANKVQDRARFDMRYEKEVVRPHVLQHTRILKKEYKQKLREEFYMLPDDALRYGVIDEVVEDLDAIL